MSLCGGILFYRRTALKNILIKLQTKNCINYLLCVLFRLFDKRNRRFHQTLRNNNKNTDLLSLVLLKFFLRYEEILRFQRAKTSFVSLNLQKKLIQINLSIKVSGMWSVRHKLVPRNKNPLCDLSPGTITISSVSAFEKNVHSTNLLSPLIRETIVAVPSAR